MSVRQLELGLLVRPAPSPAFIRRSRNPDLPVPERRFERSQRVGKDDVWL